MAVTFNLLDYSQRLDPTNRIPKIVEMLSQRNPVLQDMVWKEGNLPDGEEYISRTALPTITWMQFGRGIPNAKSTTQPVKEVCGTMGVRSMIDARFLEVNGLGEELRMSEETPALMALNQAMEAGFFYNSASTAINPTQTSVVYTPTPLSFSGLAPRFNKLTGTPVSKQVISQAGATANGQSSVWLVVHGEDSVYGIFPKGSSAGIQYHDMGQIFVDDGSGATQDVRSYVTEWIWNCGVVVKDWRQVVRICNIDLATESYTGDTLIPNMIKAVNRIENANGGRAMLYMNRGVMELLDSQARGIAKSTALQDVVIDGRPQTAFRGIPIHVTDALTSTEAVVS